MPGKVKDDRSTAQNAVGGTTASVAAATRRGRRSDTEAGLFPCELHDDDPGVRRLYTVAMMADVLAVPPTVVRHWRRGGLLEPSRRIGSLEWYDFAQLVIGRRLARLLAGGLSLRQIDDKLQRLSPGGAAEAARVAERIVADGHRLSIRRGDRLLGAGGQLQLRFYTDALRDADGPDLPSQLPRIDATHTTAVDDDPTCAAELLDLAADLEAAGEFAEAAEALRAVLQAEGPAARTVFMLAELLYRAGDLPAARERYYAAIELDADHLEARASLGCVLAELGEHELAVAALDGVLRQQPDYADAHWHIAGVLSEMGHTREARQHLRTFLRLAPESPWAALARDRLL